MKLENNGVDMLKKLNDRAQYSDIDPLYLIESMQVQESQHQIYLIIHCLDAGQLKEDGVQDHLAELASISQVKMVISLDHFASSRLWNNSQLDKFSFYSLHVDTMMPYDKEMQFQPELFSAKNNNQELGISFILRSMTDKQKKVVKLIAKQ